MSDNIKINEYDDFADCDGKKCGLGKHVGAGNYMCSHNNLQIKHPELIKQWHPDNKPMSSYSRGSKQKVLWVCENNICGCHIWTSTILSRTNKKSTGCPFCAVANSVPCIHNNLGTKFPHLVVEWDPGNSKSIFRYTCNSNIVVSWICQNGKCSCHKWKTAISNRTRKENPTGCPFCSSFTDRVCEHNNLEILYPELKHEWHPDNSKAMKDYSYGSGDIVWWICSINKCGCHIWQAPILRRTKKVDPSGCPFCNSNRACIHNNLEINYPQLKIEWHPDNFKLMSEYSSRSSTKVKWGCSKNSSHLWETVIYARTSKSKEDGSNCPHCCKSRGYSDAEINWLTSVEKKENIIIRNALDENGQFKINGVGKVDGYCQSNNTVYEFNGDFWHGNPSIYNRDEINPVTKTSFGELYDKTIKREQKIIDLGYNLVVKWETNIELKVEELDDEC